MSNGSQNPYSPLSSLGSIFSNISKIPVPTIGSMKPANMSYAPQQNFTPDPNALGAKAKNPGQNVKPPQTKLPANQTVTPPPTPPAYDTTTGLLTDYGKSKGLPEVNAKQGFAANPPEPVPVTPPVQPPIQSQIPTPQAGFTGSVAGLAGAQLANGALGSQASQIANNAGQQISQIGQNAAQTEGEYNTGMITPRAQGLAQQVAQTAAAQQQAVAQGATQALAGNQQALTAQAQTQSAQQAAGNLTQPVAGATFFGSPENGGIVGGAPNAIAGATLAGQVAGAQQNAQTAATATPNASNTVYQKAYSDYQDLAQNVSNVDQFGNLLTSGMVDAQGNVINPSNVKYANQSLAQIRNQLSVPQQAQYDTTLAALKSKISGMLAVGGSETPTALTNDAQSILDGSAPLGTLNAVLSRIQQEGNALLTTQANKVNQAKTNINGGTGNNSGGTMFGSFFGQ